MQKKEIKIGILGFGGRGCSLLAPLLNENLDARLTTIIDPDIPRAKYFMKERIGNGEISSEEAGMVKFVENIRQIKEGELDVLLLTASEKVRTKVFKDAVLTGAHLFVEKGLSNDLEGARTIVASLKHLSKGQKIMMGFNRRYDPLISEIKKIIDLGMLGRIRFINYIEKLCQVHGAGFYARWHRQIDESGGMLVTKACHDFDTINYFVNEYPKQVFCDQTSLMFGLGGKEARDKCHRCDRTHVCEFEALKRTGNTTRKQKLRFNEVYTNENSVSTDGYTYNDCVWKDDTELHDTSSILFQYPDGLRANYTQVLYSPIESRTIMLLGSKGGIHYDQKEKFLEYRDLWNETVYKISANKTSGGHGGADTSMIRAFYNMILNDEDPKGTIKDGIAALCGAIGAYASAEKKTWVNVEELISSVMK